MKTIPKLIYPLPTQNLKPQTTFMKTTLTSSTSGALARRIHSAFTAALLPALLLLLSIQPTHAGSATWKTSPLTGNWNAAGNWTTGGPPNGPSDVATFATSNKTTVLLSADIEVSGITLQ